MQFRSTLLAAAAALLVTTAAQAVPVSGQLSLNGYAAAIGSTGMGAATGIDFVSGATGTKSVGTAGGITSFGAGTGSFAGLSCSNTNGGCGVIQDIQSFASDKSKAVTNFLTLTTENGKTISFDLTSISNINHDTRSNQLGFTANGFINETGYDRTAGTFNLTAQGDNITSFSATTLASNVPEPASMALLGGSLALVGLVRRKKA